MNPTTMVRDTFWHSLQEPWRDKRGTERVALALVVLLLVTLAIRESLAQSVGAVAAVFTVAVLVARRRELRADERIRPLRLVAWGFVAYFVLHAVRYHARSDLHALDGPSRFLLLAPLVYLPWIARVRWPQLLGYLSLGGMAFGATAFFGWLHPVVDGRAFGLFTYLNLYGYASGALLGLMIVTASAHRSRVAWALGAAGCVMAMLVSGTRGAWLVLPLLLFIGARHLVRAPRGWRYLLMAAGILAIAVASNWSGLENRLGRGIQQFKTLSDPATDLSTSVGERYAMWTISVHMIEDKPWVGHGLSVFPWQMQPWADRLGLHVRFPGDGYHNPHQQYLGWAVVNGVPVGIVLMALAFLVPAFVAVRRTPPSLARSSVLLFLALVAVFCLTESVIERQRGAAWFLIWVGLLLGLAAVDKATDATPRTEISA